MPEVSTETPQNGDKYYTVDEALEIAHSVGIDITYATLLAWIDRRKLGFQPGGTGSRWFVYRDKFDKFIRGENVRNHNNESHA